MGIFGDREQGWRLVERLIKHEWWWPVMQDLAADQLTDDSDLAWGCGGPAPANMCHRRKFFKKVLAFTIFLCFFRSKQQWLHLQSAAK